MAEFNFILPKIPANKTFICTSQTRDKNFKLCVSANCTIKKFLSMLLYEHSWKISDIDSNQKHY
jgi:hypothetical protein